MRKQIPLLVVVTITSLFASAAFAECHQNGRCWDRAEAFREILSSSQASQCPNLSSEQALAAASAVSTDQLSLNGFVNDYSASCNYDASLQAAVDDERATDFVQIMRAAASSTCPNLSADQALGAASAAEARHLSPNGFSQSYAKSCNYQDALAASQDDRTSNIYAEVMTAAASSQCPNLASSQALQVAQAASTGYANARGFESAYAASCDFANSFNAASDGPKSDTYVEVLRAAASSTCPNLSSAQALQVASASDAGTVNAHDFESAYSSSCNFEVSLAAAQCQVTLAPPPPPRYDGDDHRHDHGDKPWDRGNDDRRDRRDGDGNRDQRANPAS